MSVCGDRLTRNEGRIPTIKNLLRNFLPMLILLLRYDANPNAIYLKRLSGIKDVVNVATIECQAIIELGRMQVVSQLITSIGLAGFQKKEALFSLVLILRLLGSTW